LLRRDSLCHWQIGRQAREDLLAADVLPKVLAKEGGGERQGAAGTGEHGHGGLAPGQDQPAPQDFHQVSVQLAPCHDGDPTTLPKITPRFLPEGLSTLKV